MISSFSDENEEVVSSFSDENEEVVSSFSDENEEKALLMMFFYKIHACKNNKRDGNKMAENYSEMEISAEEFYEVINSSDKLIVVNFFAEWHMPCLMFFPVIEDLAEQMKEVQFVKVNIDDNQDIAEKHNVSTMPCLVIFRNGKEINRIIGAQSIEVVEEKIKGCLIAEN